MGLLRDVDSIFHRGESMVSKNYVACKFAVQVNSSIEVSDNFVLYFHARKLVDLSKEDGELCVHVSYICGCTGNSSVGMDDRQMD